MDDVVTASREKLLAFVAILQEQIALLQAENAALGEQVRELQARLGQNSSNSSRPPSSDLPSAPSHPPPRQPGRRRGAQPGHEGHLRMLVPADQVTRVVEHWPAVCRRCRQPLAPVASGEPVRHQVIELPPVQPEVIEHRLQRAGCPACGVTTLASLPPDLPAIGFGPRLQAVVALLSGRYRLSRREVVALCGELFNVPICVGSVQRLCTAMAAALAVPVKELEAVIPRAPVAHADETGWAEAGQRRWLWVVVTAMVTVFRIAPSRGSGVIKDLLGEQFDGYLVTDRWSAYSWVPAERRGVCWAHLRRDFQALVDYGGTAVWVGRVGLVLIDRLFAHWHCVRDDPVAWAGLAQELAPLQAEFGALLEVGTRHRVDKVAGLCRQLLKLGPALWTFATVPGVEPTNNTAERTLRPAVLWRKGCFGSQSTEGAEFVARLLSVTATCKQQRRNLLDYLANVCEATYRGNPVPSLLPASSSPHGA